MLPVFGLAYSGWQYVQVVQDFPCSPGDGRGWSRTQRSGIGGQTVSFWLLLHQILYRSLGNQSQSSLQAGPIHLALP